MPRLAVAGAGMAGLAAAVRARELGADVVVHEKGDRPGGSMLLSSCVVWRYREWERFRAECPGGDPELQRVVWEGLDETLAWLEGLGAPVVARDTGNPLTTGIRFDPRGLTEALVRRAGGLRLGVLTQLGSALLYHTDREDYAQLLETESSFAGRRRKEAERYGISSVELTALALETWSFPNSLILPMRRLDDRSSAAGALLRGCYEVVSRLVGE